MTVVISATKSASISNNAEINRSDAIDGCLVSSATSMLNNLSEPMILPENTFSIFK